MAFNLAMDIVNLFVPQKVIWGLNMTTERKLGVSIILLLVDLSLFHNVCRGTVDVVLIKLPLT
jgi:hypothetical protein